MFKTTKSEIVAVKRHGGGALGEERLAIRNGVDGEFWPEPGQTWKRFYGTMNGKVYQERQSGLKVKMVTEYAICEDEELYETLDESCKVDVGDGRRIVKILKVRHLEQKADQSENHQAVLN